MRRGWMQLQTICRWKQRSGRSSAGRAGMIHYLFGISVLTPVKIAWVAITLANVAMMCAIWFRSGSLWMRVYLGVMATSTLIQGTGDWNVYLEAWLALWSSVWIWSTLPKDRPGRIFALSVGLVVTCVLMLAVPPPWPHYDPSMYYTRLYSTAAFLGISLGSALITRNPSTMLAVPWFMAVLIAGSQRGLDRWFVGIVTNLMWTACLICWLSISRLRPADRAALPTPDALSAHPPTSLPEP
jgi:hypothetical protein